MKKKNPSLLSELPGVDSFLSSASGKKLVSEFGTGLSKFELDFVLTELRASINSGKRKRAPSEKEIAEQISSRLKRFIKPVGRKAINATGILLHTGLGRSPLSKATINSLETFSGYNVLQAGLEKGERTLREEKIQLMLQKLTGTEAVAVTNNNAAATLIALNTMTKNKEVIISRGQLVEIGGSYRIPEVMEQSGAILKAIGTTNKTHLRDYEKAITENTAALLIVHPSNYRIQGFSGTPSAKELSALAKKHGLLLINDLGSGSLVNLSEFGLKDDCQVQDALKDGADLVCFSGDKLLGGPQSGIICGKKSLIHKIRKNPFMRMFRVGKMTLAALETTLSHYVNETFKEEIPLYQMLSKDLKEIKKDAEFLKSKIKIKDAKINIEDDVSYIGGGAFPDEAIPTKVLSISPKETKEISNDTTRISKLLRNNLPSVFARVNKNRIIIDLRSVFKDELDTLADAINKAFSLK